MYTQLLFKKPRVLLRRFTMFYGRVPFVADSINKLYQVIQTEEVVFPAEKPISPELRELILGLLTKDHTKRMTLPEVMMHR